MHKKDGCVFVFYDNFLSLCKSQNIFPIEVRRALGISQSTMASWKSRGLTPKYETLSKIADYFGVSVDYLLGNTEQKEKPLVNEDEELTEYLDELKNRPEMKMLFSLAKGATKEDVEKAVKIIETLLGK